MKKRTVVFWSAVCPAAVCGFLFLWTHGAEKDAHFPPPYPRRDITAYVEAEELEQDGYQILFEQTGLAQCGVDTLREEKRGEALFALQNRLYEEVDVTCTCNNFIYRETVTAQGEMSADTVFPALENGDILITFGSHFFGWRNGHAAIVVDAEHGLTVEALSVGCDSRIMSLEDWKTRPNVAVLRLRNASETVRQSIADYAAEELVNQPYCLTAGLEIPIAGTQCAHLVWCAYEHFGYDIDGDKGLVVTPKSLFDSPLLETVQVYGLKIN